MIVTRKWICSDCCCWIIPKIVVRRWWILLLSKSLTFAMCVRMMMVLVVRMWMRRSRHHFTHNDRGTCFRMWWCWTWNNSWMNRMRRWSSVRTWIWNGWWRRWIKTAALFTRIGRLLSLKFQWDSSWTCAWRWWFENFVWTYFISIRNTGCIF